MKNILSKPAFWLCVILAVLTATCFIQRGQLKTVRKEKDRLDANQTSLLSQVEYYRSENGDLVATVQSLSLRNEEISSLLPQYENEIRRLRIDLNNVKNMATINAETNVDIVAPLLPVSPIEDSQTGKDEENDFPKEFSWRDNWVEIRGKVFLDSLQCSFSSRDSLLLVAHYTKRKCLFAKGRKGKLVKYDVKTKNPHTCIGEVQYIEVLE